MKIKSIVCLYVIMACLSCGEDDEAFVIDCLTPGLQNGVIAFYPFNNGSLLDESGNQNDLTNTTAAMSTSDRTGNSDCAYLFDNSQPAEQFLTTATTGFLDGLSKFSISLWYQPMDINRDGGDFETLVSRGDGLHCPNKNGEWSVALYDCRRAVFGHNNDAWADFISTPFECDLEVVTLTDSWHHVAAVKDDNEYKLYFNGVLNDTSTGNANCTNLYLASDTGDLFIGKTFLGKIDDILIYNRALSQAEVGELNGLAPCCQ